MFPLGLVVRAAAATAVLGFAALAGSAAVASVDAPSALVASAPTTPAPTSTDSGEDDWTWQR
ncbi:hypothetical protein J5J01_10545 [Streptomyces fradiae]|uniref:hypothetical protein n=1 Tax=Streptomyces fradiae TaxID=1906 RepID=UPI00201911C5|nr:hypothetical protein [Streptomyces fradiae]UQS31975.1 hypothetical protein J5J01_10545 [Streptomyces fradiae]